MLGAVGGWLRGGALVAVAGAAAGAAWWFLKPQELPPAFASGNGRVEAVEVDIAAKIAGRIKEVLVNEGEFVRAGQTVAEMDSSVLEAQLREAQAQLQRARISIETAESLVVQREAEKRSAEALVAQRRAELDASQRRFTRSGTLVPKGAAPESKLDDDRSAFEAAKSAVAAAEAQAAAAQAAIGQARSSVVGAHAAASAAQATVERIQADIDDSVLKSPRDGRVQYRVAQPGEVVSSGGVVLNMVDLGDVYMTFFLPTAKAGKIALGTEARLVLDAAPQYVIPAEISFVSDVAQFTPKTVETAEERQKLMFRLKARIDPSLLRRHLRQVKTGLPGMAYVPLEASAVWPGNLQIRLPE